MIGTESFYGEYHGHKVDHLHTAEASLRKIGNESIRQCIYLAGDSSLDNKFWISNVSDAINGYENLLQPPISHQDVAYWINFELKRNKFRNTFCLNCAVEESSIGSRACGKLLVQDRFIRDTIHEDDFLVVSVGGNDIALRPSICTILNILMLLCCTTTDCLADCANGCSIPFDDYCCGFSTSCLSNFCAWPPGYGYFISLFGARIQSYIERITAKTKPKVIIVCMIYYPDEEKSASWADPALSALGYDSNPRKLQVLIDKIFRDASQKINIPGTRVVAVPLSKVLNGKFSSDYSARVEPSEQGGHKMAKVILEAIFSVNTLARG
jgi:hypothetical protein